jgi:hypothetical protein
MVDLVSAQVGPKLKTKGNRVMKYQKLKSASNGSIETKQLAESWFKSLQRRGFKCISATAHIDQDGVEFLTVKAEMHNPLPAREPIKAGVES